MAISRQYRAVFRNKTALVVLSGAACGVLLGKALARDRGEQP